MSTDFLNRRMDLIHTFEKLSSSGSVDIPGIGNITGSLGFLGIGNNILTMDTSYPVRLAGKVIKIFTACSTWTYGKWYIRNSDGENILEIVSDNVFDFAGRVIAKSIGDDKPYYRPQYVYKKGDYVMAIIDFDNASLHLCSETNFSVFVTGDTGDKETFKLFDISGDEKIIFNNEEILANKEAIKEAIKFDSEDGHFSFIRNINNNVVYQIPENNNDDISAVPVSDVDIANINSFNASCYPLLFPNINTGYAESFELIDSCRNFIQMSGTVNSNFIKNYCYTASELIELPIINYNRSNGSISSKLEQYLVYYISDIFAKGEQENYYYYIREIVSDSAILKGDDVAFKSNKTDYSQVIIPISIDTNKFSQIDNIGGNKESCNGARYELNMLNNYVVGGNIIGNWWASTFNTNSAWTYYYEAHKAGYPSHYGFLFANDGSYMLYDFGRTYSNIYNNNLSNLDYYISAASSSSDLDAIMTNKSSDVKTLMDFFCNNDDGYKNYIYKTMLSNNHHAGAMVYTNGQEISSISPVATIFMCREDMYESVVEGSGSATNLYDYSKNNTSIQNRYKYLSKVNLNNIDKDELRALAYKLFTFNSDDINNNNSNSALNVSVLDYNNKKYRTVDEEKFKFITSNDFLPDSTKNNTNIFIAKDNSINVCHFLSRAIPRAIDNGYGALQNGLISDIGISRVLFTTQIYFAKMSSKNNYLYFDEYENGKMCLTYFDNGNRRPLYITTVDEEDTANFERASFDLVKKELEFNHTVYLYYNDNSSHYRMKLCVDGSKFKTNWNNTPSLNEPEKIFTEFDYFTKPIRILQNVPDPNDNQTYLAYDMAYCNFAKISKADIVNNNIQPWQRIAKVAQEYRLNKNGIQQNTVDNIAEFVVKLDTSGNGFNEQSTLTLTIDLDYNMYYYRHNGNINNRDFRISDLIPENTFIYTDGPAPLLSKTINKDGAFIYNIETYQDFISSVYIADITSDVVSNITTENNRNVMPLLNKNQLKYINGKGIREEYYNNVTIYDFFRYTTLYDLAIPKSEQVIDSNSNVNMAIYNKGTFNNVDPSKTKYEYDAEKKEYHNYLYDSNNNRVNVLANIVILCKIDNNNRYGFNEVSIINKDGNDVTSSYIVTDKIYATIEKSGNKSVMNIALTNKDNILLNINGILGNLNRDKINWETLLLALSNNKTIDLLSDALIETKKSLNNNFLRLAQNVNDEVSISNNASPPENIAEFDNESNIYKYKPNEGYDGNNRIISNRGVIVFVTKDGSSTLDKHGHPTESSLWTEDIIESKIHAKRMYISKDGLLCTKDYFTREAADENDSATTIKALEARIAALEEKLK